MYPRGTPVIINGRTGGTPGPATTTVARIRIPNPARNQGKLDAVAPVAFARRLQITNLDATNNLLVYLGNQDAPVDFLTVKPNTQLTWDVQMTEFTVASSASTVQWEALAIVAS